MNTPELEYKVNGWHAHSGAGPRYNRWWLAEYKDGEDIDYLRTSADNLVLFKSRDSALARADKLNNR